MQLRQHDVRLSDGPLHLRPMTEDDWDVLLRWNNDPEVLYYSEGGDKTSWSLEDMQAMYRGVSQHAYVFIAELDGRPIGECWLQEMNEERVKSRFPGQDVRRIDLMIGEKALWGKGWGTRIIALLTRFAFQECGTDVIYNPEIGGHNPRSRRAFEKNGYVLVQVLDYPEDRKCTVAYDLILTREAFEAHRLRVAPNLPEVLKPPGGWACENLPQVSRPACPPTRQGSKGPAG
jgi:RimJ/RimL family protein N-acetyltransferase